MNNKTATLSRREILRRTALLLGVSAVSPAIASAVMAGAQPAKSTKPRFLKADQLLLVAVLTEMILPATNTPGANAAGVHHYIDVLLDDYFSALHRKRFMQGLADVDARAKALGFKNFIGADADSQHQIALAMDREAYATSGEEGAMAGKQPSHFFRELKELTLTGYYTSEIGATVELAYQPIPGHYKGCVPYEKIGRAWAT